MSTGITKGHYKGLRLLHWRYPLWKKKTRAYLRDCRPMEAPPQPRRTQHYPRHYPSPPKIPGFSPTTNFKKPHNNHTLFLSPSRYPSHCRPRRHYPSQWGPSPCACSSWRPREPRGERRERIINGEIRVMWETKRRGSALSRWTTTTTSLRLVLFCFRFVLFWRRISWWVIFRLDIYSGFYSECVFVGFTGRVGGWRWWCI